LMALIDPGIGRDYGEGRSSPGYYEGSLVTAKQP
jgi:hypothetical protein